MHSFVGDKFLPFKELGNADRDTICHEIKHRVDKLLQAREEAAPNRADKLLHRDRVRKEKAAVEDVLAAALPFVAEAVGGIMELVFCSDVGWNQSTDDDSFEDVKDLLGSRLSLLNGKVEALPEGSARRERAKRRMEGEEKLIHAVLSYFRHLAEPPEFGDEIAAVMPRMKTMSPRRAAQRAFGSEEYNKAALRSIVAHLLFAKGKRTVTRTESVDDRSADLDSEICLQVAYNYLCEDESAARLAVEEKLRPAKRFFLRRRRPERWSKRKRDEWVADNAEAHPWVKYIPDAQKAEASKRILVAAIKAKYPNLRHTKIITSPYSFK